MKKPLHLLVDGDIILHRFGCTNQIKVDWDGTGVTSEGVASVEEATTDARSFLVELQEKLKSPDMTIIFSGPRNFRYSVLPSYKWNRKKTPKPLLMGDIKDFLRENYDCLEQDKLEGDDLMGIISTANKGKYIICSIDKDMKQIPGKHYNWNFCKKSVVTKEDADWMFYMQVLMGDPGDGYTGIPGIGQVKAAKILLANPENLWDAIVDAYATAGLTEDEAIQQARVARILRHGEYDFEKEEVKLWTP
jgi:DNA polymerase-1